jgi:hypothetical protein
VSYTRIDQLGLFHKLEGAKHGDLADPLGFERGVNLLLGEVPVGVEEMVEDFVPLVGLNQAFFLDVFMEDFADLFREAAAPRRPAGKKNEFRFHC